MFIKGHRLGSSSSSFLPDESGSVAHHSIRAVLVLSYVMDKGEDELHPRLDQHHISCEEREEIKTGVQTNTCRVHESVFFFALLGPAKPGSSFKFWLQPEASRVKKTQISLRRRKILLIHCSQEEEPTSVWFMCLTVHVLLVALQALDDPGVRLQTALPQLVQVVHHVIVRLKQTQEKIIQVQLSSV